MLEPYDHTSNGAVGEVPSNTAPSGSAKTCIHALKCPNMLGCNHYETDFCKELHMIVRLRQRPWP